MKMISFFILLQLAGIYSTHEITKHIDKWVSSIFTIGGKNGAETFSGIYGDELKDFEYNISNQERNFHTKCIVYYILFHTLGSTYKGAIGQQIDWKFSESKISTFFEGFEFFIETMMKTGVGSDIEKSSTISVSVHAKFKNFTLTALRSYTRDNYLKTTHEFTYSSVDYNGTVHYWYPQRNLTAEDENQLNGGILSMLPIVLQKSLKDNQTSIQKLDDLFQKYEKPRQEIIAIHPDFLSNPLKYYYLIPKIPFFCFILKRIVIHGLSNFEWYRANGMSEIFTHTLLIRNIQGSMTLDYRSEKENDLELNFQIDHFILWKQHDTDCVYARARYYTITRRKTKTSLSGRQSEVIMERLQSVLASGLLGLPSKEIDQICNVETPLDKIRISNSSDWKTIKESYIGWIPFHDDEEVIPKKPFV